MGAGKDAKPSPARLVPKNPLADNRGLPRHGEGAFIVTTVNAAEATEHAAPRATAGLPYEVKEKLPPLLSDTGFLGMTVTQFLGAFNDNVYKQLLLLTCLEAAKGGHGPDRQGLATAMFALPFVLFSGFAGFLADKFAKKTIFVLCKVAEIVVMLLGVGAFWLMAENPGFLGPAIGVIFLMGTHSAFFGPAKYGILPEMLRDRDLPAANGYIQMTTFMAIILGMPFGGKLKDVLGDRLWLACSVCVAIAALGTLTSLFVRRVPRAQPGLQLNAWDFVAGKETWKMFGRDRTLLGVLFVYAYFWFVAGIVPQSVNAYGKLQLEVTDFQTSLMTAWTSIGIAIGCVSAGKISGEKVSFGLVKLGAWGITLSFAALAGIGQLGQLCLESQTTFMISQAVLAVAGIFTGFMAVPLQVFLQVRPPAGEKGQVMGAMNLSTWTGIFFASGVYEVSAMAVNRFHLLPSTVFLICSVLMFPIALVYRPKDYALR